MFFEVEQRNIEQMRRDGMEAPDATVGSALDSADQAPTTSWPNGPASPSARSRRCGTNSPGWPLALGLTACWTNFAELITSSARATAGPLYLYDYLCVTVIHATVMGTS